jgi:hypothetical protein
MREPRTHVALTTLVVLVVLVGGVLVGRATSQTRATPAAVSVVDGIAVGTVETQAGALAAADNYLAIASQSVEQNPSLFARLVRVVYAPWVRSQTLTQAARLRRADTVDMTNYANGGRAVAVIAARRLDHYTPRRATVTTWLGGFVWGPNLSPRQSWNLVLAFRNGRWLIVSSQAERTPAPVPSTVFIDGRNNTSAVFDLRLAGMSGPFYGTG